MQVVKTHRFFIENPVPTPEIELSCIFKFEASILTYYVFFSEFKNFMTVLYFFIIFHCNV